MVKSKSSNNITKSHSPQKFYTDNEVGLLVIVTLGGIIIFLVLVMLALLNVKLCCQADHSGDMNSLLQVRKVHSTSEMRFEELLTPALLCHRDTAQGTQRHQGLWDKMFHIGL